MEPALLKDLVTKLIELTGLSAQSVEVKTGHPGRDRPRAGRTMVAVTSDDSKDLIGPSGETLRALNSIAKRMVEQKYGEDAAGFLIDINDYHEAQMERVRASARMLAQRARLFKHDVEMPPASPYERLVVHELFAEDPEIKTESAGEGKFRHIVLKYRSGATA